MQPSRPRLPHTRSSPLPQDGGGPEWASHSLPLNGEGPGRDSHSLPLDGGGPGWGWCRQHNAPGSHHAGFTLLELVVVLVVLSITAVSMSTMFSGSVSGYLDAAARQDKSAAGRAALDRLGRELREAMPLSVRTGGDNRCVQFMPIQAATFYTDLPAATTRIPVAPFPSMNASGLYLAIYPVNDAELYGQVALRPIDSFETSGGSVTAVLLSAAHTFPRSSPGQRAYILSAPLAFCLEAGGQLRRYTTGLSASAPVRGSLAGGALLSANLDPATAEPTFSHTLGSTRANALVTVNLAYTQRGERLALNHETRLRNVQ